MKEGQGAFDFIVSGFLWSFHGFERSFGPKTMEDKLASPSLHSTVVLRCS